MGKNQHVTPHHQGGWQVKGAGNQRATVRTETQAEARAIAREIAINNRSELVVHSDNNTIDGRWFHLKQPIYDNNCGHGMLFNTKNGELKLVFHKPNIDTLERPCMIYICEKNITDAICNCVQTSERVNFRQELEKAVL